MNQLIQQLHQTLPKTQIITDELRLLAYGTDASFYRLTPEAVSYTHLDVYKRQSLVRPPAKIFRLTST